MAKRKTATTQQKETEAKNKINRKHLLDALVKVRPGIANKEVVENSTHFNFSSDRIWTDNDEISVAQKFNSGITGSIKAQEFYDLIAKLPFDEVFIDQKEDKVFISDNNRFEAIIKTIQTTRQQGANPPESNSKKWMKLPPNFSKAATFCVFSASKNITKPELTCIFFVQDDDKAFAISCDGYRGTMFYLNDNIAKDFLLPANVAKHMKTYNPTKYIVEDAWMHFMNNENTVISCRVLGGEYPEQIWGFFDVDGDQVALPQGTGDVIRRVETLVTEEFDQDRAIEMVFSKDKLTCIGKGPLGSVTEKIEIDYKGKENSIKVHPTLLADILKHLSTVQLGERLKFCAEDFEHCVCLFESTEEETEESVEDEVIDDVDTPEDEPEPEKEEEKKPVTRRRGSK